MNELRTYFNAISPITDATWEKVSALFSESQLKKGQLFIDEGQIAAKIGFLKSGVVRAFYRNSEGTEYNKHFFVPNSIVGGYALLITGKPNKIVQQALTDCQLLTAGFRDLSALYHSLPDLERVARKLAELYFVDKEEREIEIVLLDADKRYAIFQKQYPGLEQIISQYHIASYLGITPTQLSRIRRKLSQK